MDKFKYFVTVFLFCVLHSEYSEAALESRFGGALIYDSDLDITWLADANFFKAQQLGNPSLIDQIISDNEGIVNYEADWRFGTLTHSLSASDFNVDNGSMNWFGAVAWSNALVFGNYGDWTLPTEDQLAHLYFDELGGVLFEPLKDTHDEDYYLFKNIQSSYWSSSYDNSDGAPSNTGARLLDINSGYGYGMDFSSPASAWAVRKGDVSSVPVPGAFVLFSSFILSFFGLRRAKYRSAG